MEDNYALSFTSPGFFINRESTRFTIANTKPSVNTKDDPEAVASAKLSSKMVGQNITNVRTDD